MSRRFLFLNISEVFKLLIIRDVSTSIYYNDNAWKWRSLCLRHADEDGYVNFMDYQDQLIEAEARAFANMFRMEDAIDE